MDSVEGVDLLRPRVVDPVGEDELSEVNVKRPGSAIDDLDIESSSQYASQKVVIEATNDTHLHQTESHLASLSVFPPGRVRTMSFFRYR